MAEVGQRRFVLLLVRRTDVKWLYTHSSQTETFTFRGSFVWRLDPNKCQFNSLHTLLSVYSLLGERVRVYSYPPGVVSRLVSRVGLVCGSYTWRNVVPPV